MAPTGTLFVLLFAISGLMVYPAKSEAFIRTPKPAIILVPAAFSRATVYDHVKSKLYDTGYDVVTVDLPSVGDAAEHVDRTADIKVVQEALRRQIHHDQKVILVGNSYGCTVICDALKDFENEAAVSGAADGKIMGVIFFSGFIPYMNELSGARPDIRQISPPWFRYEGTSRVFWDGDLENLPPSVILYNLLSKEQADVHAMELQPSSFAALNATAKYIPYDGKFRSLYVVGSQDNAVPLALAQSYLAQAGAKWETETIDSDHSPMLSRPDEFVEIIRRFAGEMIWNDEL